MKIKSLILHYTHGITPKRICAQAHLHNLPPGQQSFEETSHAFGAGDQGFDSRAGQNGSPPGQNGSPPDSRAGQNGSPPLRRFLEAVLSRR